MATIDLVAIPFFNIKTPYYNVKISIKINPEKTQSAPHYASTASAVSGTTLVGVRS